ncbi:hypothetical protein ACLOJK_029042 [Asimina triloba]
MRLMNVAVEEKVPRSWLRIAFLRFESYCFFSSAVSVSRDTEECGLSDSDGHGHVAGSNETMERTECRGIDQVNVVLWAWRVGFVLCAWLLRRKIISIKVAAFPREAVCEDKL